MTKDKLMELYNFFKKNNIDFEESIKGIKNLSNDDIDKIINSEYPRMALKLLTSKKFNNLTRYQKAQVLYRLDGCDCEEIAENLAAAALSNSIQKSGEVINVCRYISQSAGPLQAYCVGKAALSNAVITSPWAQYLLETISRANRNAVYTLTSLITDEDVLNSGKIQELINVFNHTKSCDEQIEFAADVARELCCLNDNNMIMYIKAILEANSISQASIAKDLVLNYRDITIADVEIICKAANREQAKDAFYVIISDTIKENKETYASIIADASNDKQSFYGREFLFFSDIDKDLVLPVLKLICNSDYPQDLYEVTKDIIIVKSNRLMDILNIINNAKSAKNVDIIIEYLDFVSNISDSIVNNALMISNLSLEKIMFLEYDGENILKFLDEESQDRFIYNLSNALTLEEMKSVYMNALRIIEDYDVETKMEDSIDFDKKYKFWPLFEHEPNDAIKLLDSVGNVELTSSITLKRTKK